jgi:hypothetical protein
MQKILITAIALAALSGGTAFAQSAPTSTTMPPAVSTSNMDSKTTAAPVAGANSFTETQARSRIEKDGYTDVGALTMDSNSVWRGMAQKDSKPVSVSLDYQGNVVSQ